MGSLINLSNYGSFNFTVKGIFVVWFSLVIVLCVFLTLGGEGGNNGGVLSFDDGENGGVFPPRGRDRVLLSSTRGRCKGICMISKMIKERVNKGTSLPR